ncbi:MAG: universal stress protein [Protaetiibacter sp.]
MERILVGVDTEAPSARALDWAVARSRSRGSRIHVVSANDVVGADVTELEQHLLGIGDRLRAALPRDRVSTALIDGPVVETMEAEARRSDLLVVGYHRRHPVRSILSGALPERLAARVDCPTVIVPEDAEEADGPIVVGIAPDDTSESALEFAATEALRGDRELVVVYAWMMPSAGMDTVADLAGRAELIHGSHRTRLDALVDGLRLRHPSLRVREELVEGRPVNALIGATRDPQLIVVGTHRRGPVSGLILGSTVLDLLPASRTPVCVVPFAPVRAAR